MEIIWDSTGKAIFRDYSKYKAGFLQYGWNEGTGWNILSERPEENQRWCLCVGVKEREEGWQEHDWAAQGSWRGGAQNCPTLQTDQQ